MGIKIGRQQTGPERSYRYQLLGKLMQRVNKSKRCPEFGTSLYNNMLTPDSRVFRGMCGAMWPFRVFFRRGFGLKKQEWKMIGEMVIKYVTSPYIYTHLHSFTVIYTCQSFFTNSCFGPTIGQCFYPIQRGRETGILMLSFKKI